MKKAIATTALTVIALAIPALAHDRDDYNRDNRQTYTTTYNHVDIRLRDQRFDNRRDTHERYGNNTRKVSNNRYAGHDRDRRDVR
ncbi:MAG TPA: hypothetical protein VN736_12145 [Candidatus Limnocylindrales bacterium]|nr:hypothetical protein [Candidatus Limnocylindrales bacterium]